MTAKIKVVPASEITSNPTLRLDAEPYLDELEPIGPPVEQQPTAEPKYTWQSAWQDSTEPTSVAARRKDTLMPGDATLNTHVLFSGLFAENGEKFGFYWRAWIDDLTDGSLEAEKVGHAFSFSAAKRAAEEAAEELLMERVLR